MTIAEREPVNLSRERSVPIELESHRLRPGRRQGRARPAAAHPAVFALYGAEAHAEPYIGRTPNLRGAPRTPAAALAKASAPPATRRPRAAHCVAAHRLGVRVPAHQFALLEKIYGAKALGAHAPARSGLCALSGRQPLSAHHRHATGPASARPTGPTGRFASRAAAERFAEEALKLFLLRRCTVDLDPDPSHPGCVYSEMKMCLAPCYKGCTDERYAEEAAAVRASLATRGESRLVMLRTERDEASDRSRIRVAPPPSTRRCSAWKACARWPRNWSAP